MENVAQAHRLAERQLSAVAIITSCVAVRRMTLKGTQRDVDVPVADLVIHELLKLDVDSKPTLGVAEGLGVHWCPFERLRSWEVLELSVVETSKATFLIVPELPRQLLAG